jgi:energy-coupling factor transport system ATP-binding protein
VSGPSGLLLDEPTVGQDRRTWAAVLGAVRAATWAGAATAVATHDRVAAAALASDQPVDRLVLSGGRVV